MDMVFSSKEDELLFKAKFERSMEDFFQWRNFTRSDEEGKTYASSLLQTAWVGACIGKRISEGTV